MLQNPDDYVLVCQIPYIFIHIYSHRINDGVTGKMLIEVSFYVKYGRQTSLESVHWTMCLAMSGSFISQPDRNIRISYCPRWHENNQDSKAG